MFPLSCFYCRVKDRVPRARRNCFVTRLKGTPPEEKGVSRSKKETFSAATSSHKQRTRNGFLQFRPEPMYLYVASVNTVPPFPHRSLFSKIDAPPWNLRSQTSASFALSYFWKMFGLNGPSFGQRKQASECRCLNERNLKYNFTRCNFRVTDGRTSRQLIAGRLSVRFHLLDNWSICNSFFQHAGKANYRNNNVFLNVTFTTPAFYPRNFREQPSCSVVRTDVDASACTLRRAWSHKIMVSGTNLAKCEINSYR